MLKVGHFSVDVLDVIYKLQEHGYFTELNTRIPNNYMVTCPFHKNGKESKPSFGIHKENGTSHCFTCGWRGSIFELVHQIMGVNGEKWIEDNVVLNITTVRRTISIPTRGKSPTARKTYNGWEADFTRDNEPALKYLASRGITGIDHIFPIGYWKAYNSVSFVIRDTNGEIGWIKSRRLDKKQFYNNAGSKKSLFVFGLYECIQAGAKVVWLCESETDCLTVWSRGEYAVATSGATLSDTQVALLKKYGIRTVIDGMDRDKAGREGWEAFKQLWQSYAIETDWGNIDKKDINNTTIEEFKSIRKIL